MKIFKKFPRTFWIANTSELFERWAWYGLFMVLAIYLTGSKDTGALGFSQQQKGMMMGVVSAFLYFFPIITGAIADRVGYKKILLIAFAIYAVAYVAMGHFTNYTLVFIAFFFVGIGAALFKPVISATIAKTTTKKTSSIGFGIFYMMVNLGAFIGPIVASKLREINWTYVFYMAAAVIVVNFFLVLFFYKEPVQETDTKKSENKKHSHLQKLKEKPKQEPFSDTIINIFKNILVVFKDFKFLIFLIIIVGFWTMYLQLFYSLPNFIEQWMDTAPIYDFLANINPKIAAKIGTKEGTIAPEMLTNIDALYIVIFQVFVSSIVMKIKPLSAMIAGIFIASIGIGLTFMFNNPFYLFISILIFGLGEMSSSPKITEYIGRIAPKDKKGLYMGMSFLPLAGGNFLAGILSGSVYGAMSDKITLVKKEFTQNNWNIPEFSDNFTKNDLIQLACDKLSYTELELTKYLWDTYHPQNIWYIFTGIGIITTLSLFIYDKIIKKK